MAVPFHAGLSRFRRKLSATFLAFFWTAGLICGCLAVSFAGDSLISLMRSAAHGAVSIVGVLCVTVFPFFLSAFAVYIAESWLLLPICFCKAFCFSFISLSTMLVFSSAGWLVRLLFCFADTAVSPLLYLYWLRHISGERGFSFPELAVFALVGFLIGCIDYRIVSPFLMALIN